MTYQNAKIDYLIALNRGFSSFNFNCFPNRIPFLLFYFLNYLKPEQACNFLNN